MLFLNRVLARGRSATPTELEFGHGLQASYRHFGVGDAVFALKPQQRGSVVHVVVRDAVGEVVGGARVHRASPGRPLPALRALGQAPALRAALVRGAQAGLVELAALWVKRDEELRGLGRLIGQASIAAAAVGGAHRAVTFSHLTIAGMLGAIGMRPTPDAAPIGYPNARYQSTVWEVDPRNPEHAHPEDREQIEAIRDGWTDDPSASIAIEATTGAPLSWSVVDPLQPLTHPERVHHHVHANRPQLF